MYCIIGTPRNIEPRYNSNPTTTIDAVLELRWQVMRIPKFSLLHT